MMQVLIVEDEMNYANALAAALQRHTFTVKNTPTAAAARALLRERTFDAILVDLSLPDDDGLNLLHWVRSDPELASTSIMVLSAYAGPEVARIMRDAGARWCLQKGDFRLDWLASILAQASHHADQINRAIDCAA